MKKHARNYMRIYNQYNIPYYAKPGDDLFAAARLDLLQKMGAEVYERVANGQDQEEAQKEVEEKYLKDKVSPASSTAMYGGQMMLHPKFVCLHKPVCH